MHRRVGACPLRQTIENKAPVTAIHTHYDAQGSEIFVEVTAAPVLDAAGDVTHIIEACRDITQRKRAEESLARTAIFSAPLSTICRIASTSRMRRPVHCRQPRHCAYHGWLRRQTISWESPIPTSTRRNRRRSIVPTRKNYCAPGNHWSTRKSPTWIRTAR